jgi:hypothetical protein
MKKIIRVLFSLVLAIGFSSVLACSSKNKGCTIEKQTWINYINTAIPAEFCKDGSPFLQCYAVSQTKCLDISLTVTKDCINKKESTIPKLLDKADSIKWGEIIGSCAGDKLTDKVKLKKGKKADCGTTK